MTRVGHVMNFLRLLVIVPISLLPNVASEKLIDLDDIDAAYEDSINFNQPESTENLGPSLSVISHHPYIGSLLKNGTYVCTGTILNELWFLTISKCVTTKQLSYIPGSELKDMSFRVGSSYYQRGGSLYRLNFARIHLLMRTAIVKLYKPLIFNILVKPVKLPAYKHKIKLGYLTSMASWAEDGHLRMVNSPVIESEVCEEFSKLDPTNIICVAGVQDVYKNNSYCKKDHGAPVLQEGVMVAIATFKHVCAEYPKSHPFPKISGIVQWIEKNVFGHVVTTKLPTTAELTTTAKSTVTMFSKRIEVTSRNHPQENEIDAEEDKFMPRTKHNMFGTPAERLKLPYPPLNVPIEVSGDNHIGLAPSMFEAYLKNHIKRKTPKVAAAKAPDSAEKVQRFLTKEMNSLLRHGYTLVKIGKPLHRHAVFANE